ncbi:hypothetical protein HDU76_012548 [Blyttiomyces sp. JEL0837]|nr:hypothetical protein HDU76_012548 [Blyttiomyces sp. JEL0837]
MSSAITNTRPTILAVAVATAALLIPSFLIFKSFQKKTTASALVLVNGFHVLNVGFWKQTAEFFKLGGFQWAKDMTKIIGDIPDFWCYLMLRKTLKLASLDNLKFVLVKATSDPTLLKQNWPARWVDLLGKDSLPTADVSARRLRAILLKSMSKPVLAQTFPMLQKSARTMLTTLAAKSETGPVQVLKESRKFTYTAIIANVFGADEESFQKMLTMFEPFLTWEEGFGDFFIPTWMNGPFAKAMKARVPIVNAIQESIDTRRKLMELNPDKVFNDGLALFLIGETEQGEKMTDSEVIDNSINYCFAGFDTSASTIASLMHVLLYEISEKDLNLLRDEILSTKLETLDEPAFSNLPVLDAFIKELLRLYAPINFTFREVQKDLEFPDGRSVPKGTTLAVDLRMNSFDTELYPEPEKFDLGRFLVDEVDKKAPYSYTPFSAGARMCVGFLLAKLEIKVVTFELIRNFELIKSEKPSERIPFPLYSASPFVYIKPKTTVSA